MSSNSATAVDERPLQIPWLSRGIDWLTEHQREVLAAGVAFQLVVLLVMIAQPLTTLLTGDVILLRVAPVDPRDLFRGDYVTLSYEINRPASTASDPAAASWRRFEGQQGRTVYVLLEPEADGKHWRSHGYQFEPPADGKFIRGTIVSGSTFQFGIEQYYVQEGTGAKYEQAVRDRKLSAEVALDHNGRAQLRRLVIE